MIQLFLSHSKITKTTIVTPFLNNLSQIEFPYWFDREKISCGEDIYSNIIHGIDSSTYCIAFIDNSYLNKEWTLKEINLFHEKEIQSKLPQIIPVYCGVPKEVVYQKIPWLKDRAFEKIEKVVYSDGECEKILCRVISRILYDYSAMEDTFIIEKLLIYDTMKPFYDIINTINNSQYYNSRDLRLSCIELCNIITLLNIAYNLLHITPTPLINSLFKLPSYIKHIIFNNHNYLDYDFVVLLKRSINYMGVHLLQFLNP